MEIQKSRLVVTVTFENCLVFDIETNGLLKPMVNRPAMNRVHCVVAIEANTGTIHRFTKVKEAVAFLNNWEGRLVGHNIAGFDIPALERFGLRFEVINQCFDTMLASRLLFPELKTYAYQFPSDKRPVNDFKRWNSGSGYLPGQLIGRYSLEAMGYRIGVRKDEFGKTTDWQTFTPEMLEYCEQDVVVNLRLFRWLMEQWRDELDQALWVESRVSRIITIQEANGWQFNKSKAIKLEQSLMTRQSILLSQLREQFPPMVTHEEFIPKVNNARLGYRRGEPITKIAVVDFNPGSRQHIAQRLQKLGWKPTEFTKTGIPTINDEILEALDLPEASGIQEYLANEKLLGMLSQGQKAWLRMYNPATGRIHGSVDSTGTSTFRMTHNNPNIAQVPNCDAPHGSDCRALFEARPGYRMVGCDAAGLEARILGHFLARWDNLDFAKTELEGRKEDGTDGHTVRAKALGISRNAGKTWFYAYCYGAGDAKLGFGDPKLGKRLRARFEKAIPAFGKLRETLRQTIKVRKGIRGVDGRFIAIRSSHSALNYLCQSAGAIVMKYALVELEESLVKMGLDHGVHWFWVGNIHDEFQIEARDDVAIRIGEAARLAIIKAGEQLSLRVAMDGEFQIGANWAETH